MMLKDDIREVVRSQKEAFLREEKGVEREVLPAIDTSVPWATVISGVRRCGKSTLLHQLMAAAKPSAYINFEDPRAAQFEASDFQKLEEACAEEYGNPSHFFLDEVQNVPQWERMVRALLDRKKHVILTGSNASLLSRELGTRLTGRHVRIELFPFSYREFLALAKQKPGEASFAGYLHKGGFPEYLTTGKAEMVQQLFTTIITRDIAVRHRLRNIKTLQDMGLFLLTNAGREFSFTRLKNLFSLGSTNSAISFVSFFEDSYLLMTIPRFSPSFIKRLASPRKVYAIDTGLSRLSAASFSEDTGPTLENAVFLELRRQSPDILYYHGKGECDFLVREGRKIVQAVQVCTSLTEENKARELNGLCEALEACSLPSGLLLTINQEDTLQVNGRRIQILPAWKWAAARAPIKKKPSVHS